MKIQVKLNKDEAEAFKNFFEFVTKNTNITFEDFTKQVFFNGIDFLNHKLNQATMEIVNNPELRQQLEASGFNISELETKEQQ